MAAIRRYTAVLTFLSLLGAADCWAQSSRQGPSSGGSSFGDTLRDMRDSLFGSPGNRQNDEQSQYDQPYQEQRAGGMNGGNAGRNRPTRDARGMQSGGSMQGNRPQASGMPQRGQQNSYSGPRESSWKDRWFGGAFADDQSEGPQYGNRPQQGMPSGARMSSNRNAVRNDGYAGDGMSGNRRPSRGEYDSENSEEYFSGNGGEVGSTNRPRTAHQQRTQPRRDASPAFDPTEAESSEDGMNYAPPRVAAAPRRATLAPRVTGQREDSDWHNADEFDNELPPRTARARPSTAERRAPPVDVVRDEVPTVKRPASSRRTAQPNYRPGTIADAPEVAAAARSDESAEEDTAEAVAPRTARRSAVAENRGPVARGPAADTELSMDEEPAPIRSGRRARPMQPVAEQDDAQTSELADSDAQRSKPSPGTAQPAPRIASSALPHSLAGGPQDFVVSNRSPVLQVETAGPRRMMVGKAATYKVSINNAAEVAAEDVTVMVSIPAWADVLSKRATTGDAHESAVSSEGALEWTIPVLGARRHEELALEIVARENRSFELAVQWNYKPVATQTQVEVQEPKLEVAVDGPDEVSYGEKTIYKLSFSNPGTADAEQVVVRLLPLGPGEKAVDSHTIGRVAAGATKVVEVELIARQEGDLKIKVEAEAEGGLKAAASQDIRVLRAGLHVAVEAPKFRYTGAVVNYEIKVSNPGTETARDVQVTAQLPKGAKFVSCSDGGKRGATSDVVAWKLDFLKPREDRNLTVKCIVEQPGSNHVHVAATAAGELTHSTSLTTQVEPVADLVLQVNDPQGAVPAGDTVIYELIVKNRGAKTAEDVEVLAAFSDGVEPVPAAEGEYAVEDGKVIFPAIAKLLGGQEHSFKIKARALVGGNHLIRAEVHCQELDISLAAEETTRFYGEASDGEAPAAKQPAADDAADAPVESSTEAETSESPEQVDAPAARYSQTPAPAVVSEEEPALLETAAPAAVAPPAAIEARTARKSAAPKATSKASADKPAR
jgi:uncharacterized repeat protein (TIGR01451 family)